MPDRTGSSVAGLTNMACEAMVSPPGDFTTMLAGSAAGDFEVGRNDRTH
jgi:hypothetical protein